MDPDMALLRILQVCVVLVVSAAISVAGSESRLAVNPRDLRVEVGRNASFQVSAFDISVVQVLLQINNNELIHITSDTSFYLSAGESAEVRVRGVVAGHAVISANASSSNVSTADAFVRCTIQKSNAIHITSQVVGWIYFVAWSVSFYPQIYENWRRKSVVGLNFDFLALNIIGFILYGLFNCGLYWIPQIEELYFERYPNGHNPVMINDIVFALHATFATIITIIQCCIYERENQSVSVVAKVIMGIFAVFLEISFFLAGINVINWLDFLYYCSYVKLSITLIKYCPQAYMNYRRQSTVGWSIGNIFLDFTGGMLSMLQMILNSHNYNDWESIFGDPTKFGLGLFSVVFDIFFMVQHYILYRGARENASDPKTDVERSTGRRSTSSEIPELPNGLQNDALDLAET